VIERAALDAAMTLGKQVVFQARGGDVRLSAEVLSALRPALVQLARNAVAHGIESPAVRRHVGKDEAGLVEFVVERRGHAIRVVCSDDGAGIDLDAVAQSARRAGHADGEVARLDREDLLRLLLRERISTSHRVTNAAGRGVGMDVVRDAVERLSAQIDMSTRPGLGSSFELLVPVSMAAVDALIVQAGMTLAAIPMDAVERTAHVRAGDVAQTARGQSAWLEHSSIPFAHLADALAPGAQAEMSSAPHSLVVVRVGEQLAAIGVDRLHGTARILVRPLPRLAPASPLIGGVAIDSHGDPQLVLDPAGLLFATRSDVERAR
jgi:two-component system chemotaxis sensor kinase CheA